MKTYETHQEAYRAGGETVQIITHADAAEAYRRAIEAEQAIPAAHNRKRHSARAEAIDSYINSRARYATFGEAAQHIAGCQIDYLHRTTVNLGTSRYPDFRPEYEQHWINSLVLHGTASKTGKSIDTLQTRYVVLVIG